MVALSRRRRDETDVAGYVRLALRELKGEPNLKEILTEFLESPGRVLGKGPVALWPKLVTRTSAALGGFTESAPWPTVAVEFAVAAIDVADDLSDGDLTEEMRVHRAPGAALALSWLSQHCCVQAAEEFGFAKAHRIGQLLATGALACCAGQDSDVVLERDAEVTEEAALAMSWRKAGSLAGMACAVGAACASDSIEAIEIAGRIGAHLGMVAQLVNDIDGIVKAEDSDSGDVMRRKKTLPVAYALSFAREEQISTLLNWYADESLRDLSEAQSVARTIHSLGALHYTWLVARLHRQHALDAIKSLEAVAEHLDARALRELVPPLDPD